MLEKREDIFLKSGQEEFLVLSAASRKEWWSHEGWLVKHQFDRLEETLVNLPHISLRTVEKGHLSARVPAWPNGNLRPQCVGIRNRPVLERYSAGHGLKIGVNRRTAPGLYAPLPASNVPRATRPDGSSRIPA